MGKMCFFTGQSAFLLFLPEAEGPKDISSLVLLMAHDAISIRGDQQLRHLLASLAQSHYCIFNLFVSLFVVLPDLRSQPHEQARAR
jgi:hypothetical protein